MNEETMMEGWGLPETVSTEELDEAVQKLIKLEDDYEAKKKVSNEASDLVDNQRTFLLALLQKAHKTKYHVDGLGTVSMALKKQVQVPKNPADKKLMLEYFESLGPELYNSYVTVNSMTLNSYFKQQVEIDPDFTMPGITGVTEKPELRFRKER